MDDTVVGWMLRCEICGKALPPSAIHFMVVDVEKAPSFEEQKAAGATIFRGDCMHMRIVACCEEHK